MRRQAVIAWPTRVVPSGGVYDEEVSNDWKGVVLRSLALGDGAHLFSRDVKLKIGDAPALQLKVSDGNGNGYVSLVDVPYRDLKVEKGQAIRLAMKNDGGLDARAQVVAVLWVDDGETEDGPYRHTQHESGPVVVPPGGSATLVVAPAEELPFRSTFFHLTGGKELTVTSLRVGAYEQLALPEVPGTLFLESEDMQIAMVLPKQQVSMIVQNRRAAPVTSNFKLEGVNLANVPVMKAEAMAKYGKFAQAPVQPPGAVDDDDDDDLEDDDE